MAYTTGLYLPWSELYWLKAQALDSDLNSIPNAVTY